MTKYLLSFSRIFTWVATYYECFKKLVTILDHFFMINPSWSRCVFCKMRVSMGRRTIHVALASILYKVLALLVCKYGTGIGSITAIAAAVF